LGSTTPYQGSIYGVAVCLKKSLVINFIREIQEPNCELHCELELAIELAISFLSSQSELAFEPFCELELAIELAI